MGEKGKEKSPFVSGRTSVFQMRTGVRSPKGQFFYFKIIFLNYLNGVKHKKNEKNNFFLNYFKKISKIAFGKKDLFFDFKN